MEDRGTECAAEVLKILILVGDHEESEGLSGYFLDEEVGGCLGGVEVVVTIGVLVFLNCEHVE